MDRRLKLLTPVLDTLLFLGQLKGLSRQTSRARAETYLREVELWDARESKIKALSRGMHQKAQFVAGTMHEPDLIIIDEPFSGLDPVNTRTIKRLLYRMQDRGAAIIMSTHQMHQVEEMCGRILLLDRGRRVLYGPLDEIRRRFTRNAVEVDLDGELDRVPGVKHLTPRNGGYRMLLAGIGALAQDVESSRAWIFVLTLPMMLPIYLWMGITSSPHGPLAIALSTIPFSSPIAMLMRLTSTAVPGWQIGLSLALLSLTGVGMIWLMGRLFRVQTLLSGESISLRRAWSALRG